MDEAPDSSLDALLPLDGEIFFIDAPSQYWVKFEVKRVEVTAKRPHGLRYALTLHGPGGERIVGFDNAHAVTTGSGPGARKKVAFDHKHRLRTVRPYEYRDAASLLEDFWEEVENALAERGVKL